MVTFATLDPPPATAPHARVRAERAARAPSPVPSHVVHAIAVLRGIGRTPTRPLREAEAQALAILYRAYGGMVRTVARAMLSTEEDADDVLHDVFARLPWAIACYADGRFGGWLRQVAVRTALMRLRAERTRAALLERALGAAPMEVATPADFAALDATEAVRAALATLREPLRQVVVLRLWMDLPHAEIARQLGITPGASEVRLCRALRQLREVLAPAAAAR